MIITGIGNGKEIFKDKLIINNVSFDSMIYDLKKFKQNPDLFLIVYDDLYINKYLEDFSELQEINHIPIFITSHSVYVFGEHSLSEGITCCPYCMVKRITTRDFSLNLYEILFDRKDFKSISYTSSVEFNHFIKLLLEIINEDKLKNHFFNYNLLSNLYHIEEIEGLSKCEFCDSNQYNQGTLLQNIKEV